MEIKDIKSVLELRDKNILSDDAVEKAIRKIVNNDVIVGRRPCNVRKNIVVKKDKYAKARERMAWIGAKTSNLVKNRGLSRSKAMRIACARWKKIFKG